MNVLQNTSTNSSGTYLGCPNVDKRRTKLDLTEIRRRIDQKLASWEARTLSTADKIILIKSNRHVFHNTL